MPIACAAKGGSSLSGVDGSIAFIPAGTSFCLLDHTDFSAANGVALPVGNDLRVGDPVTLKAQGSAKLDTVFTAGTTYYIVDKTAALAGGLPHIKLSATKGGAPLVPNGDGGATGADTPGSAINHIKISFAEHLAVCEVNSWDVNLSREEVDTTSLQCGPSAGGGAGAPFRTKQAGYVDGSGSVVVKFTRDQGGLARRLLQNSLRKSQDGASVQLFVDTIYDSNGKTDLDGSTFIEGPISILGFSVAVATGSEPTTGTINFSFSDQPTNVFGVV